MKISNWDIWQTFRKDRGTPPWIKVYRNLLSNEQWVELSDSEKGQLVSIWILAADKDGTIPDSPKMIQRMAMLDSKPNLSKFIDLGFMTTTCQPDGNHEIKPCPQVDAPEKRREDESRSEKSKTIWVAPDNLNLKAWAEFEQHRKEINKSMSDLARTKAANQICYLSQEDQQATVDKSISSKWSGLFPDKTKQKSLHNIQNETYGESRDL